MSKNGESPKVDETQKQFVQSFEEKKNELKKKKKLENPDGRLTGLELKAMIATITGFRDANGSLKTGVGNTKATSLFNTKLISNLLEAEENLTVIQELTPKLSEKDQEAYKKFEQKRLDIAKKNAGIPETEDIEEVRYSMIQTAGNTKIYENEIRELEEEYKPVLSRKKAAEEKWREIMQIPLAKCDFDMIKRHEVPDNLTAGEIGPLWPMICETCGDK